MELKLVVNRELKKPDHLAIFDVDIDDLHRVKALPGHQWVSRNGSRGYNKLPFKSLYAIVATFPGIQMSPGMRRLWDS